MDNSLEACKKRALRILGRRSFSESEMKKRLVEKGETPEDAEETVRWLVELGYIDDDNYATLIVNHYFAGGYGQVRIRDELNRRGIPREMWEEKLNAPQDPDGDEAGADPLAPAVEYLRKKLRGSTTENEQPDKDDLRRAREALVRRGFSFEEASEAIKRYITEQQCHKQ